MHKIQVLLLLLTCLFSCKQEHLNKSRSIHAIPTDAALILESNNLARSIEKLSESAYWETLRTETSLDKTHNSLFKLDSNLASYASHLSSINPVFLSLHSTGSKSFNWLIISSTENQKDRIQLLEIGLASFTKTKHHNYTDAIITEVFLEQESLFYSNHRGLLIVSQEKILIEDAIRQLKTPTNLSTVAAFNDLLNSVNKKEDYNLYLNTKYFDRVSNALFKNNTNLATQAEWMQWDVDLSKNGILFSGISVSHDSLAQELSFYQSNKGHETIATSVLPKNTALFTTKSFENFKQLQRKQKNSNLIQHKQNSYTKSLLGLTEDLKLRFDSWIDDEISWFLIKTNSKFSEGIIIHTSDDEEIENFISQKSDSLINYRDETIYSWNELKYLSTICYSKTKEDLKYAIILNEQLILSYDLPLLKSIINDFKADLTISSSVDYKKCMEKLNTNSNLFIYLQNPSALELTTEYLNPNLAEFFRTYATAIAPFKALAIQFDAAGDNCYSNAYMHFSKQKINQTRALWTTQLEAPILSEISLVKNHYNQQWEIAVQDQDYNLYLISTEGEILWKRKLEDAIIGTIEQIDVFKNKKLQLLFNTSNKLFLIDRKGRDVKSFPISLKHKTELALALFDYQKQRNYRILLSCGKHQYMFDQNGKRINGWKLNKTKSKVTQTAQHFVVASKDYILLPEENGTLNILNRKGETRIKVKDKIDFSNNKLHIIQGKTLADSRIVTIDKNGVQQNILFDGSIDNGIQFKFDHEIYYSFELDHHVMIESESIKVSGSNMNLRYSFNHNLTSKPVLHSFKNQMYMCVTDFKNEETFLFREPNELIKGFPIYGKTRGILKDLDLDQHLNLIVGGESGLIYNYSAE